MIAPHLAIVSRSYASPGGGPSVLPAASDRQQLGDPITAAERGLG